MTLNVYFVKHKHNELGTAVLLENMITKDCQLEIDDGAFVNETYKFINDAVEILKKRYETVTVEIHDEQKGEDEDVTTDK